MIYTYKVTFEGTQYYYWGVHKDNGRPYKGSPVTNRWAWDMYETSLQILEIFDDWAEACKVEQRIIRHTWDDPNCLNAAIGRAPKREIMVANGLRAVESGQAHEALEKSRETLRAPGGYYEQLSEKQKTEGVHTKATKESRAKGGAVTGSKPWWNNGVKRTRSYVSPGEGWKQGFKLDG
jgi:hypothetical protein